jgi:hypothetical protein
MELVLLEKLTAAQLLRCFRQLERLLPCLLSPYSEERDESNQHRPIL